MSMIYGKEVKVFDWWVYNCIAVGWVNYIFCNTANGKMCYEVCQKVIISLIQVSKHAGNKSILALKHGTSGPTK